MSQSEQPDGRLIAISSAIYCALLALYPLAFRREFGNEMAQVFRTALRREWRARGAAGVVSLWMPMVSDLIVTALRERLAQERQEIPMSRLAFIRAAGAVTILGGALYLLVSLSHPMGLARAVVPLSVACLLIGVIGLHACLWGREGWLGWLGAALAATGLALGVAGMTSSALQCANGCRSVVGASANIASQLLNTGEHAGLVFIGAGMLLWGVVALRTLALGRWSILPLVIGLIGMAGIVFLNPSAFSAFESSGAPLVFAVCWILLGYALLTRHADAPTPSLA
jgi:hypothetical protein